MHFSTFPLKVLVAGAAIYCASETSVVAQDHVAVQQTRVQQMVDDVAARLGIADAVHVSIVPANRLLMSVEPSEHTFEFLFNADATPPDMDDPRVMRAMNELERDMEHLDENNPKHMAHMMRKMKDLMPSGSVPKELDVAIKRLEAGEDPEKIEADMGDVLGDFMGGPEGEGGSGGRGYSHDAGLYDY